LIIDRLAERLGGGDKFPGKASCQPGMLFKTQPGSYKKAADSGQKKGYPKRPGENPMLLKIGIL
jgi:hypothetical protein